MTNSSCDRRVLMLLGPTAVGKTAAACALQERLGGRSAVQLISVDSAMVYRGMNIGTAKPDADELARFPHELIDIREPEDTFTAADFVKCADTAVADAFARGQLPVIVGGTMLYAKCFIDGIARLPAADRAVRETLALELNERGHAALHAELMAVDPIAAERIHPHNPQRLLRALEVVRMTGQPVSRLWREQAGVDATERLGAQVAVFVIDVTARNRLHALIANRFDQMLALGFVAELEGLAARLGRDSDLPSMRAVGYRQGLRYVRGEISLEEFRRSALTATRRLAKRQITWLRDWPNAARHAWEDSSPQGIAEEIVRGIDSA